MKIFVKTLKGTHFEVEVKPEDTVADVKKNIEIIQGPDVYPATQQMLIHQGKVLKDGTTLEENKVVEKSFVVIMITKSKASSGEGSTASSVPKPQVPQPSVPSPHAPAAPAPASVPASAPAAAAPPSPATVPTSAPAGSTVPSVTSMSESDVYGQAAASSLLAGSNLEIAIQQILDMGGGTWDRDIVVRALRAAYNNPERAVDYLYSGIPESAEAPTLSRTSPSGQGTDPPAQPQQAAQATSQPSTVPNANPLDLFPRGVPSVGSTPAAAGANPLDFLRNSQQFQALRAMVQSNPQVLQPMLQELGKQNPHLMRLIQEHQADFLRLVNEPVEGDGRSPMIPQPQAIQVTPEEHEAIERLQAMGFDRALVVEVFFACNKNEELAANYLLDHINDFED